MLAAMGIGIFEASAGCLQFPRSRSSLFTNLPPSEVPCARFSVSANSSSDCELAVV